MALEKRLREDYRFATISTSVRDTRVPGAILSVTNPQSASRLLWSNRACRHATIDAKRDLTSWPSAVRALLPACYKCYVCVCVCGVCLCGVWLRYRGVLGEEGDEVALEDEGEKDRRDGGGVGGVARRS